MPHEQGVAADSDDALHERRRDVVRSDTDRRILWRRGKDDNVTTLRVGISRQRVIRERNVGPESKLVDEEPVTDEERRLHAAARNAIRFGKQLARSKE